MESYKYPTWFSDKQKSAFDEIRKVAAGIGAKEIMVDDLTHDATVLIKLEKAHAESSDWAALDTLDSRITGLFVSFIRVGEDEELLKSYPV